MIAAITLICFAIAYFAMPCYYFIAISIIAIETFRLLLTLIITPFRHFISPFAIIFARLRRHFDTLIY
jgi:hypothetical protein